MIPMQHAAWKCLLRPRLRVEIRIDLETVFIVFEAHNGPASWYQMYLVSALGPLGKAQSSFFF